MLLDFLLAISEVQTVFCGQFFTNLLTSESIVTVRDSLAVIIYSVESDMYMRVLFVKVAPNDVLRIFYPIFSIYS